MEKKKIEDEDIKLWHKIIYYQKCAQISRLESEINEYKTLLSSVQSLNVDLVECTTYLKNTYTCASSGVSCADFDEKISNIGDKAIDMQKLSLRTEDVIKSIETEIEIRHDKIASIKATMWMI